MIVACPLCLGKFSGIHTHSHTTADVFDQRFADCGVCHGRGAITCEMCEGAGRVEQTPDGIRPAKEFAQEQRDKMERFVTAELTGKELRDTGQRDSLKQFVDRNRPEWSKDGTRK